MIKTKDIRNADYQKHASRAKGEYNPCIICGRRAGLKVVFVHLHNGGRNIVTAEEAQSLDPSGDMGLQPIGLDCLAKHPEVEPYIVAK